jgi:hypothetical protein
MAWLKVWPSFDSLPPEPSFKDLHKKMNLDQLQGIVWSA